MTTTTGSPPRRPQLTADAYVRGVLGGDRAVLGRAITLVESEHPEHRRLARRVLEELGPRTGGAQRVGISGVPGVGKSTFIEALGRRLTAAGHRVAVLAVDPSSQVSGGSILADKTRMATLATDPAAFIRPSPAAGSLGGVARKSRETLLVCEAAGFDVVLVETVGVGQSETAVAEMVDSMIVLMLAGAGDDLQGIKRGILEVADILAIHKADGDNAGRAQAARRELETALQLMRRPSPSWRPPVLTCSSVTGEGVGELWAAVEAHRLALDASGELAMKRRVQRQRWMWALIEDELLGTLRRDPAVAALLPELEAAVLDGGLPPTVAAERVIEAFVVRER